MRGMKVVASRLAAAGLLPSTRWTGENSIAKVQTILQTFPSHLLNRCDFNDIMNLKFMNTNKFILFNREEWDAMAIPKEDAKPAHSNRNLGILHHALCQNLAFTGDYQMPIVHPVNCPIPSSIIGYHRTTTGLYQDSVYHFYTDDSHFERIWKYPYLTASQLLKRGRAVISPDFSVYAELLLAQKVWNIFRNKLLAAWWQRNEIVVIPNVSWINENYDCSFDGWPKHSVIAVNSTGVGNDERCKTMWIQGYRKMLDVLSPLHILRYGAKQEGEIESISTYYENDNYIIARYGWK